MLCGLAFWSVVLVSIGVAAAQPRPTFTKDIAPLVWQRCASCHRPGEIGPFSLLTFDDVKRRIGADRDGDGAADHAAVETGSRQGRRFQNERRLTDQPSSTRCSDGSRAALPKANDPTSPPLPTWNNGWRLGPPDLVVRMAAPYRVTADSRDVFRTFVIPIPVDRVRYVRAMEFHPGNARVVHHANLGVDRTRSSRQLDLRDAEPGYAGSMERDARYPEGQLLGWTPGQAPHPAPAGTQWRLEPGSDLVVQLHLKPTGKPESVQVTVGFYFTDAPPTRTPMGLRLGSETIDIPAGDLSYIVADRASECRWMSRCSPCSRTRTTSRAAWRRRRRCPTARSAG